ncbi:MAG: hypothetical protein RL163_2677, partial [Pseudomonadota bacterium]
GSGPLASFNGATIDASGTSLTLTFAQALGVPSGDITSRFAVTVGGSAATVSTATVDGAKVTLTLASAAAANANVTVRYTDPNEPADSTEGVLEYPGGADVPSIGDTPVVRLSSGGGMGATPVAIYDTASGNLEISVSGGQLTQSATYTFKALVDSTPSNTGDQGTSVTESSLTLTGTLNNGKYVVAAADVLSALSALTPPTGHGVVGVRVSVDADGSGTTTQPVVLNLGLPSGYNPGGGMGSGPLAPMDGAILSASGASVTLTYAQALLTPSGDLKSLFTVKVDNSVVTISSAQVVGDKVTLNLASPAPANASVTVSYSDPNPDSNNSGGVLEYTGGADVLSIGETPVVRTQPSAESAPSSVTIAGGSSIQEGSAASYTVSVTTAPTSSKTLQWRVVSAASSSAVAQDFGDGQASQLPGGTVTIASGATSGTFSVSTFNDTLDEPMEGYKVEVGYLDANNGGAFMKLGEASTSIAASDQGPAPVIDLGAFGKLIAPVQVDGGKTYYYWDLSGDGTTQGADGTDHNFLDAIFRFDAAGNPNSGTDTTKDYRFASINGVTLALPTLGLTSQSPSPVSSGGGNAFTQFSGTAVGNANPALGSAAENTAFDDYMAIWDAYNGVGTTAADAGSPPAWHYNSGKGEHFWAADRVAADLHAYINLDRGQAYLNGYETNGDGRGFGSPGDWGYVALQVIGASGTIVRDGDKLIVNGSGSSTPSLYVGGTGNDQQTGSSGNDVFMAGPGSDQMTGGSGADRFVFKQGDTPSLSVSPTGALPPTYQLDAGFDWVKDFGTGDKIDLSGLLLDDNLSDGLADSRFAVIRGTFDAESKAFTTGNASSPAALVIYDGNSAVGDVSVSAILLASADANGLPSLNTSIPGVISV